jgi:uncharacterized protein DUF87
MTPHPLPIEALDNDIAILGKKGGGKTYTAKGIIERLLDLQRRVLILDPLGIWAGLRTSADGKNPGYPIAIFGGEFEDVPLDPAAAEPLAKIIGKENLPAVVDLSELSKPAQQSFLVKFLDALRVHNRDPLTLVLEEADVFAPQTPLGDDSKKLHAAIDWIARRGRHRGWRLITVTQRPARLSKDVLTQAATLIAHRIPSPQDREAIKAWVEGNGDRDLAREVFGTLSKLAVGEAWVWATECDMLERVHFPKIKTLDTSATPKAGETRIEPKTIAQVDVSAIREAIEAATEETKGSTKKSSSGDLKTAEQRGYERGLSDGRARGIAVGKTQAGQKVLDFTADFAMWAGTLSTLPTTAPPAPAPPPSLDDGSMKKRAQSSTTPRPQSDPTASPFYQVAMQIWPARMTWAGLGAACKRKARGGHFNTIRKALIEGGHVQEDGALVTPTNPPTTPPGTIPADLLEANLPQPAAKMFSEIRRFPQITIGVLAEALGMQPRGGHWNTGMSVLRINQLIEDKNGALSINPELEASV